MKVYACDNCDVVVGYPWLTCPACEHPDTTYTHLGSEAGVELTTEQKEATQGFAQMAGIHDHPRTCFRLFCLNVLEPLRNGQEIPKAFEAHYISGFAAALCTAAYARALGLEPETFAFEGEERQRAVEDIARYFDAAGFDAKLAWNEEEGLVASTLSRRDDGLTDDDVKTGLQTLMTGGSCVELTEPQQRRLVSAARHHPEIEEVHHGEHEEWGRWVAPEPLEDILEEGDVKRDYEAFADIVEENPTALVKLLARPDDARFMGLGMLVKVVCELLSRGMILAGLPEEPWTRVREALDAAGVDYQAGKHPTMGETVRWIAHPGAEDVEAKIRDILEGL